MKLIRAEEGALDALVYSGGRTVNVSHLKRARDRRKQLAVTEGKVIAELTRYLRTRFYAPEYEQLPWRTVLGRGSSDKALQHAEVAIKPKKPISRATASLIMS